MCAMCINVCTSHHTAIVGLGITSHVPVRSAGACVVRYECEREHPLRPA